MKIFYTAEIFRRQIRQRDEISEKKTQAIIVVLDRQSFSHVRGNHVHETKDAMIFATPHAVENRRGKFRAKFFVDVFFKRNNFAFAVRVLNQKFNFLFGELKTQIDYVGKFVPVDRQNFIARRKFEFFGEAARRDVADCPVQKKNSSRFWKEFYFIDR